MIRLLFLVAVFVVSSAPFLCFGETDYVARDLIRKMDKRLELVERGPTIRVQSTPGGSLTTIPGYTSLELLAAGSVSMTPTAPSSGVARVVVSSSGGIYDSSSPGDTTNYWARKNGGWIRFSPTEYPAYIHATNGVTIGTNVSVTLPGTLRWNPLTTNLQVHNGAGWTNLASGSSGGTGSGFQLAADGDLNGFSLTNGSSLRATSGVFQTTSAGALTASGATLGTTTINGDLTVNGTRYENNTIIVNNRTNVYGGTTTTIVNQVIYSTQNVAIVTNVYSNNITTNVNNTYVNIGGSFTMGSNSTFDATNANVVKFPGLVSTNTSTGAVTRVTGIFDASDAAVVGIDGTTNILEMGAGSSDTNKVLRPTGSGNAVGWFDPAPGGIAEESDPVWASFLANNFTSSVDSRVEAVAVTGAVTSLNGLGGGVSVSVAGGSVTAEGQTITIDVRSASAPPYTYAVATNIQLVCNNVAWNQQITNAEFALTGPITLVPPTNAPLENDVTIWLKIPRTTNSITIVTAGVADVRGSIPVFSTNNWTDTLWTKRAGTNFFQVRRIY